MQAGAMFWIVAAALVVVAGGAVLRPLLRGGRGAERRASYDLRIYRDQLREVESDLARGAITADEAEAVRVEVSRRLLAAADAEAAETGAAAAAPRVSRLAAGGLGAALVVAALGIYASLGAAGRPDAPLAERLAALAQARAERPGQAEVEAMAASAAPPAPEAPALPPQDAALLDQLRAAVAARPDDALGQRLLARTELSLGNWTASRAAWQRAVDILGRAVTAQDLVGLAEAMILATNGYVSPEAEALLTRALAIDPDEPAARYYSGLALLQGGRADLTYTLWTRLVAEGPPDAPWIAPIAAQIGEVAALAGRPVPPGVAPPGAEASDAARDEMIESMVAGLADRLAAEGGPPEDWAQLLRSLAVLGRQDEARAIWREAREVFAADPAALGLLRETAAAGGLTE
ncbi:c-type cytochrome biogenesis protein CcmI [Amaricoccus sp.]|uniref:c-type cytochrome biogenesis protein CcmI n=1 Tax=Amaricoccus sp. TaxID=1872485 RepID=UPI001B74D6AD|nr:c-type cytochrome biogenesis protein CcmI [Amaricoccus sp.]MBP7241630.1 c-type cytochrome biogenesis protein CcmI [Amaricoccus sp.]